MFVFAKIQKKTHLFLFSNQIYQIFAKFVNSWNHYSHYPHSFLLERNDKQCEYKGRRACLFIFFRSAEIKGIRGKAGSCMFMQVCFSIIKTNKNCVLERREPGRCPFDEPPRKHGDAIQPPLCRLPCRATPPFCLSWSAIKAGWHCNSGCIDARFSLNCNPKQAELRHPLFFDFVTY